MLKGLLPLIFLFFAFLRIPAQQTRSADSIRQELAVSKEDTNKVWSLINLGSVYQWSYPDSGILYTQKALQLAKKLNFVDGEIQAYATASEIGILLFQRLRKSLVLLHEAENKPGNFPASPEIFFRFSG